jgi:hypothetical protein
MAAQPEDAGNSTANISANPSADVDWEALPRAVSYQLFSPSAGWLPVSLDTYRKLNNPATRRILLRDEQKIIHGKLLDINI